MSEEASVSEAPPREEIEEIINHNDETVKEDIKEEETPKPKSKLKSRAKPQIVITKEPVEPVEPIVEEAPQPIVEVVEQLS